MISFIKFDSASDVEWAVSYLNEHKDNGLNEDIYNAVNDYILNKAWDKQSLSDTVTKKLDVFIQRMYAAYRKRLSRINRKSVVVANLEEWSFTLKHEVHDQLKELSQLSSVTMSQKISDLIDDEWKKHIKNKSKIITKKKEL